MATKTPAREEVVRFASKEYQGQQCPVCLNPMDVAASSSYIGTDHRAVQLECKHVLGVKCLTTWLQKNTNCPVCKESLFASKHPEVPRHHQDPVNGPCPITHMPPLLPKHRRASGIHIRHLRGTVPEYRTLNREIMTLNEGRRDLKLETSALEEPLREVFEETWGELGLHDHTTWQDWTRLRERWRREISSSLYGKWEIPDICRPRELAGRDWTPEMVCSIRYHPRSLPQLLLNLSNVENQPPLSKGQWKFVVRFLLVRLCEKLYPLGEPVRGM
ncbi:hypothetical protein M501DRAFT_990559 [Patellaria atrata CBS 101060]|uniref:RING-type domain-containing protein n=1 Tax=Patellaria atrata CBS 101060 TaxID=1346257 RepID=A0A9P4VT61_9PEZI|nr:hypothetical protein M501DRAFT_990559 [Patellaria atrata CBS 101060]